jgi:2-methylisocitrate lyase-like PEP mutase family enzyme
MKINKQKKLAKDFRNLHIGEDMFVLPNIWNTGSAIVFEKQGFKAVATTSAGVAYALGYPDGEDITIDDLCLLVSQITKRINIPLSVDFERGYSENIDTIKSNVKMLLSAGAVGFNIEDGKCDGTLDNIDVITAKIKAMCEVKKEIGIDFVINARTCAFWLNVDGDKLNIVKERVIAFEKAGADSFFVPGILNKENVRIIVESSKLPVNIILNSKYNDFKGLNELGVKRLSVGSSPVRKVYNDMIDLAKELKNEELDSLFNHDFSYVKANEFFMGE